MNTFVARLLLIVTLCVVSAAWAIETTRTQTESPTPVTTPTDATERTKAQEWGLSLDEYRRSQRLLRGFTGSVADTRITPIEILGIHAKDDAERNRYAEKFAQLLFDYADRALQFEAAYQRAAKRLYPSIPVQGIDRHQSARPSLTQVLQRTPGVLPRSVAPSALSAPSSTSISPSNVSLASAERLIVFTGPDCTPCKNVVQRAQDRARQGTLVDMYVVGVSSDAQLIQYARKLALDPQLIEQGVLTLNRDQGTMRKAIPETTRLPQLLRKRGDAITLLDPGQW